MGGFRWKTLLFYGILTLLTLIAIILVITVNSKTKFAAGEARLQVDVILDAGHGGLDGGAVSPDGVCEAPITLAIAQKAQVILEFCGTHTLMTRSDETSLDFREGAGGLHARRADCAADAAAGGRPSLPHRPHDGPGEGNRTGSHCHYGSRRHVRLH